jgi:ATP-dependent DNA helicase RecG
VIREALVNALMHRNYRSASPVQIIRYSNRLEIRNPGFSLKAREHLGEPGSQQRNPRIAAVLYDTRFAETKGSGVRVMRDAMRLAGLSPPLFESDRGQDLFVARLLFHHFLGPDDLAWLAGFKPLSLSGDDAKALVFVKEAGAIDNAALRELTGLDTLSASRALARLRDAGLLAQKGRTSGSYYLPTPRLLAGAPGLATDAVPHEPGGLSHKPRPLAHNPERLTHNPERLTHNPERLTHNPERLTHNPDPLSHDLGSPFRNPAARPEDLPWPAALADRVRRLGRRSPPAELQSTIVALCGWRELTTDDLVRLLGRRAETLRRQLTRLVQAGRLQQRHPQQPNHPQQAYRAVPEAGPDGQPLAPPIPHG